MIDTLERQQVRAIPDFRIGDRVRVHFQVVEGTRQRTQVFEGVVLKQKGGGSRRTFTVRKLSFGVGVERTFPVHSPKIERIEVMGRGEVRRAKLYYLRGRVGRAARLREMRDFRPEEVGMLAPTAQEAAAADGADGEATARRRDDGRRGRRRPSAEAEAPEASREEAVAEPEETEPEAPAEMPREPTQGTRRPEGEQQPA